MYKTKNSWNRSASRSISGPFFFLVFINNLINISVKFVNDLPTLVRLSGVEKYYGHL